ncbi:MAG: type VI secretion protein ImpA, partial [Burkholderiales bacterium PBB5]
MATTPDKPLLSLNTSLGANKLRIRQFSASEEIGRLFEFNVLALADDASLDPTTLLGSHATVVLELPGVGKVRHFDGIVAAAGLEGAVGRRAQFRLVLRPWLWLLTRRADTRIFQGKTVEAILNEVFASHTHDVKFQLSGSYEPIEYCVQYRESDFNFVSRLMEQEGLYYHFEHSAGRHVMQVVDAMSAHKPYPGFDSIAFRDRADASTEQEFITDWRTLHEVQPSQVRLSDYNFTTPGTSLTSQAQTQLTKHAGVLEVYDPPGDFQTPAEAQRYAQLRMDEVDARHMRVTGSTQVRGLAVGHRFSLTDHPVARQNAAHLVVASRIDASHVAEESGADSAHFSCSFSAVVVTQPFRLQRLTPKPTVPGPQTAVVVGKSGEEITTDPYGRVKVQFHWDRLGKKDENSSCWLRVATPLAGKGWGMVSLPRIGQEVVVDFIEGDPDRPLVTGSVYNAAQVLPYKLPDHQTVSTLKTHSSKGGGTDNFNELRFDDKKGSEYIWFQAEKNFYQLVKHDAWQVVGHDQFRLVKNDLQEEIKNNVQRVVGQNQTEKIGANHHLQVTGDSATTVKGAYGLKVTGDLVLESSANVSAKSGADMVQKVGANLGVEAAANVHIKGGANVVIEAGAMLTLKCGGAAVV